jgi:membrane protein
MAASIAYFGLLSLFPLLLGIIAIGSFFVSPARVETLVDVWVADTLPSSAEFVTDSIESLIRLRGTVGVVSVLGLLWSASKMFGALSRGINLALGVERHHAVYLSPLRNLLMTATVSLLLFLSMTVTTTVGLLSRNGPELLSSPMTSHLTTYALAAVVLAVLYKFVPYERPTWREVLTSASLAALLLELGKTAFVIYIENVAHLEAIYGSLSSIVVLLVWLYFSARVLLFGAELIAVRRRPATPVAENG